MKKAKILAFLISGAALLGIAAVTLMLVFEKGDRGHDPESDEAAGEEVSHKPPPSATEIIADEFRGIIKTVPVRPEDLAEPPPAELPTTNELGSREFEDAVAESDTDDTPKENKKSAGRKIASVEKSLSMHLSIDKASSKVSKNLDKKKVMALLSKKLDKTCQPKLPDNTKSLKAQISVSKTGNISNIKVTPSAAEKELAKCMRKHLADAKVLKPKNKSVAQVTVQFKVK